MKKLFNSALVLTTLVSSISSFASTDRILTIKKYDNLNITFQCVKSTITATNPELKGEYVVVVDLEFRNKWNVIDQINLGNYRYKILSLEDCHNQIDDANSAPNSDARIGVKNLINPLFETAKDQENLVFKNTVQNSCYRKELKTVARKTMYAHPTTGERPQLIELIKVDTPCSDNVILEP